AGADPDRRAEPFRALAQLVGAGSTGQCSGGDHRADPGRAGDLRPVGGRRDAVARASGRHRAAMSESAGEKTFAPTQNRRTDAAKKGDVLRSRELSTAAVILFGAAWLSFAGPWMLGDLAGLLRASLTFDRAALSNFDVGPTLISVLLLLLPPIASLALPLT